MFSTAAFHVSGFGSRSRGFKKTKVFLPHPRVKLSIVGSRDREVACLASDRQGSNFDSVWRRVSSHSSHLPQEVLLAQFSLYMHKGGIKPDSFHWLTGYLAYAFNIWLTCWLTGWLAIWLTRLLFSLLAG